MEHEKCYLHVGYGGGGEMGRGMEGENEKQEGMEDFDQRRRCKSWLEVRSG